MKRILVLIFAFLSLSFIDANAEHLVSPGGGKYVLVCNSKDQLEYFVRECAGKGSRVYQDDCVSCISGMVESGTPCSVVGGGFGEKKVRVLGGIRKGLIGWVPMEMVSP
ncbi:hypothetical protein [Chlorobium sp. N1]|uniref:hypothetical protein n=1 Tax=Chlorobium sp. N1 TaxID=2491138 RepID=UPI0010388BC8|nr:hypothetical protein [Chlorobium sp. N1]TCD46921.1 hypothetical protein E0L29_10750 [Chlorobium sp. N1]